MVAVVVLLEALICFVFGQAVGIRKGLHVFVIIIVQLLLSDTAEGCVLSIEGDVTEVVNRRKETELGELNDTCQEDET